jgi:hypothetical protein
VRIEKIPSISSVNFLRNIKKPVLFHSVSRRDSACVQTRDFRTVHASSRLSATLKSILDFMDAHTLQGAKLTAHRSFAEIQDQLTVFVQFPPQLGGIVSNPQGIEMEKNAGRRDRTWAGWNAHQAKVHGATRRQTD